jgi:hypothetical protein
MEIHRTMKTTRATTNAEDHSKTDLRCDLGKPVVSTICFSPRETILFPPWTNLAAETIKDGQALYIPSLLLAMQTHRDSFAHR